MASSNASDIKPPKSFLLSLPPELRNYISHLIVVEDQPVFTTHVGEPDGQTRARISEPGIARTCQQLRSETLPIFYGMNRFEGSASLRPYNWLALLGTDRARVVRQYRCSAWSWAGARAVLRDLHQTALSSLGVGSMMEVARIWVEIRG